MGRDTIQLEDAVSTISQEYLLEFSSEYFIPENLGPELPGHGDHIVDFPEGKIQRISLTGFPAQSVGSSNTDVLESPCLLVLVTGTSQSRQHGKSGSDSYYLSD
ncbi:hypothetical protein Tco_1335492 [Tanacetum coccineum]